MNPLVFVVLAAGRGTRLADETDSKPKWLLDVRGETIADRQLAAIEDGWRAGDALVVVTGYEAAAVERFLSGRPHPPRRLLLHNPRFLDRNNWYSVLLALDEVAEAWPDHSVVILNSDLFAPREVLTALVDFARCGDPSTAALALDCNRPLSNEAMKVEVSLEAPVRCAAVGKAGVAHPVGEYIGLSFVGRDATVPLRAALRGFESDPSALDHWYEHGFDALMRSDAVTFLPWTIPLVDWVEIDDGADLARARDVRTLDLVPSGRASADRSWGC